MRAAYYRRLIEVAEMRPVVARWHAENQPIEEMKVYLSRDADVETHESKHVVL
jgi:hypothetical protein